MDFLSFSEQVIPHLDQEIFKQLRSVDKPNSQELFEMLLYHHGWIDGKKQKGSDGKKIRPLMLLMVIEAFGKELMPALPAAAGIELLHNFSLIHDDIEDRGEMRRGRETLWKKWGAPQAINAGDTLFSIANASILSLRKNYKNKQVLDISRYFLKGCIKLTQGQYLDISFETQDQITLDQYWKMINGKTATLLAVSCRIGAILSNAGKKKQKLVEKFGRNLGLAFQVRDDYLGIWGDSAKIGKSSASDLVSGKKTLPILFGLQKNGEFHELYSSLKSSFSREESLQELTGLLTASGAKEKTEAEVERLTEKSLNALQASFPENQGAMLQEMAESLLNREN